MEVLSVLFCGTIQEMNLEEGGQNLTMSFRELDIV